MTSPDRNEIAVTNEAHRSRMPIVLPPVAADDERAHHTEHRERDHVGTCSTRDSSFATTSTSPDHRRRHEPGEHDPRPLAGRGGAAAVASAEDDTEDLHGLLAALHVARADRLARDRRAPPRPSRPRDDLAALGLGLQPLRDVHRVADDRVLEASAAADASRR